MNEQFTSPPDMISHAISLQKTANHLHESMDISTDRDLFHGKLISSSILMALSIEIGLKALQLQEGKEQPERDHNLLKLFQSLDKDTQNRLKEIVQPMLDTISLRLGVEDYCPGMAGFEKIIEYHQSLFTGWRYLYEKPGYHDCYLPALNRTLTAIVEVYEELCTEAQPTND